MIDGYLQRGGQDWDNMQGEGLRGEAGGVERGGSHGGLGAIANWGERG